MHMTSLRKPYIAVPLLAGVTEDIGGGVLEEGMFVHVSAMERLFGVAVDVMMGALVEDIFSQLRIAPPRLVGAAADVKKGVLVEVMFMQVIAERLGSLLS